MSEELVKRVEMLPELDQTKFPPVPKHTNLKIPTNTLLGNYEKECVLGVVALVASLSHRWKPVPVEQFSTVIRGTRVAFFGRQIADAVWLLAREGHVDVVRIAGNGPMDYVVPKPDFVRHFPHGHVTLH